MKAILFILALLGIILWNMPSSNSVFTGEHSFYQTSAPCIKCHIKESNTLTHTGTLNHTMDCRVCHTRDGQTSHSAKRGTCYDCHGDLWNFITPVGNATSITMETGASVADANNSITV